MFDLTKEIRLEPPYRKAYRKLQIFLYLFALLSALYLSYLIIFPHKSFFFSFSDPSSKNNNINAPVLSGKKIFSNGELPANNNLVFDTDISSDYSVATIDVNLKNSNALAPIDLTASLRRSYQAFMYELGDPIGFRTGSLLKNDGDYYMISASKLRKFANDSIILNLGYVTDSFQSVSADDLKYNTPGPDIVSADGYLDSTLFKIADNYYILENQTLKKFVSDQAYSTRYDTTEAILKDESFLSAYPLSPDLVGFADGSLISNADSVFIISGTSAFPIDNPQTFIDKGYNWNDVRPAGEDELAIYQRAKLFNLTTPHPDGTIFKTKDSSRYTMIENGQKHPLQSAAIASSWLKKQPIAVSEKSLETYASCKLKNSAWHATTYSCQIPLDKFSGLIGFSYEFSLSAENSLQIDSLSVDYKKNIDKTNLKTFILNIYNLARSRYTS